MERKSGRKKNGGRENKVKSIGNTVSAEVL
jgi:hypothetical protein